MGKRKEKAPRRIDNASKSLIVGAFFGGAAAVLGYLASFTDMNDITVIRSAGYALLIFIGTMIAASYFVLSGDSWLEK